MCFIERDDVTIGKLPKKARVDALFLGVLILLTTGLIGAIAHHSLRLVSPQEALILDFIKAHLSLWTP